MILPPGTEKSTLAALLEAPPPARLPPPPYSNVNLQRLYRTSTAGSSRSQTSLAPPASEDGHQRFEDSAEGNPFADPATAGVGSRRRPPRVASLQVDGLSRTGVDGGVNVGGIDSTPEGWSALSPLSDVASTSSAAGLAGTVPILAQSPPGSSTLIGTSSSSQIGLAKTPEDEEKGGLWRRKHDRKGKGRAFLDGFGVGNGAVSWNEKGDGEEDGFWWKWRRWSRRRWMLIILLVVLFLGGTVGGTLGGLAAGEKLRHKPPQAQYGERLVVPWSDTGTAYYPATDGPPSYDGTATSCNAFEDLPSDDPIRSISFTPTGMNQSISTFYLPLNSSEVFIHALGDSSSGTIRMPGQEQLTLLTLAETETDSNEMRVDVVMNWKGNATSQVLVCGMTKSNGGQGVGIYTSKSDTVNPNLIVAPDPDLSFFVIVRLPIPPNQPLVNNLNITSDQMSMRIGNLTEMATFGALNVNMGRGAITSVFSAGENITLVTETATIAGTYNISSALNMNTTSGGILANIVAHNPRLATEYRDNVTKIYEYEIDDGLIQRDYEDLAARDSSSTPYLLSDAVPIQSVTVSAYTTNGPLALWYLSQDPGVVLNNMATTTNADVDVHLHDSFQGSFLVKSVIGDMKIPSENDFESASGLNAVEEEADPWGLGRQRAVCYDSEETDSWAVGLLNSTGTSVGYTPVRGNAVYDADSSTWAVQGLTVWLTTEELASGSNNITELIMTLAKQGTNTTATGLAAMRQSKSVSVTSWGGAQLEF